MISRLRKRHRIIRSNIHQTVTRETTASVAAVQRAGRGCAAAVFVAALALSVSASPAAATDDSTAQTLQSSRALMQSLRGGSPTPTAPAKERPAASSPAVVKIHESAAVPTVPVVSQRVTQPVNAGETTAPGPPPVPPIPNFVPKLVPAPLATTSRPLHRVPEFRGQPAGIAGTMQVNDVLLTSGQDVDAGATSGPVGLPPVDMTDLRVPEPPPYDQRDLSGKAHIGTVTDHGVIVNRPNRPDRTTRVQKIFGFDGSVVKNNFKRGTSKFRHRAARISRPFVERYDPGDYTDDYHMPVLLIAAQEETAEPIVNANGSGLLSRKLSDIKPTLEYAWGDLDDSQLPNDFHERMDHGPYIERMSPRTVVQWHPTNLWYYPLYFEDPGLERYGHTRRPLVQPFFSAGRFLGQVAGLPYQATLHPPTCPEYALGYYQPGEWAPKKKYQVPWNEEAAATEFLWICGLILLIP